MGAGGARGGMLRAAVWCALGALGMWLAFPPMGWTACIVLYPLALAVVAGMIVGGRVHRGWRAYALVWGIGVLKWSVLNAWLVQITEVGFPALSCYAALFDVLVVWLLVRAWSGCGGALPWAVLTPVVFAGMESLRSLVLFDGYPWFRAGHPLAEWPVMVQICDLGGEALASMLTACVAGALLDVAGGGLTGLSAQVAAKVFTSCNRWRGAALAACALLGTFAYGAWRLGQAPQEPGPGVLAIQTNLPTSNKLRWEAAAQVRDMDAFAELTLKAALDALQRGHRITLVAWPETMLGGFGLEPDLLAYMDREGFFPGSRFQRMVVELSHRIGVPMLVGSPAYVGMRLQQGKWVWEQQFNSAYLVTTNAPPYPRYDKMFLAPFGETMPYIRAWPRLQEAVIALGAGGMTFDLDAGTAPVRFDVDWETPQGESRTVRVVAPICFEDAMGWVCRDLVFAEGPRRAADLMVTITNDGWFGWFDAGRAQHLQLSRLRCIETRTPMVRVANTGLCAGIDSSGRLCAAPPAPRTSAWLYADAPLDDRVPLYAYVGEGVSLGVMAMSVLLLLASFRHSARAIPPLAGIAGGALSALAGMLIAIGGCAPDANTRKINEQPWSSREQSIAPTGNARLADRVGQDSAALPVESSGGQARQTAATLLQSATRSPVPLFRANAVEALQYSPDELRMVAGAMLADPNRGVRFVTAMTLGRAGLAEFAPQVQPLLLDESDSVRAAAIYALTRFGQKVDPTPLAKMAFSDDPEVRSNAYLVLGELGNPSALPLIKSTLGKGMRRVNPARVRIVELQAAEAMAKLGDLEQLEPIRAALFSRVTGGAGDQSELTVLAAQIAGRLHDEGARPLLVRLIDASGDSARPAEIRLMSAVALAELSRQDHPQIARLAEAYIRDRDAVVRGKAALALGLSKGGAAVPELERLLHDQDPTVQLSAAKAILTATSPH